MSLVHAVVALTATALAPISATPVAPTTAQPAPVRIITGFRSAHFRTTPSEVRKAIAADFPGLAVADRIQPTEGTRVLQLTVPNLDPGPGPAVVSYVFGATTRTLVLVSVSWATKAEATLEDRRAIAVAGLRLNNHLRAGVQPHTVLAPRVVRPGAVSLYGALDANGAGVELVASGVPYANERTATAAPTGPAALRLSYMANPANPDIRPASSHSR